MRVLKRYNASGVTCGARTRADRCTPSLARALFVQSFSDSFDERRGDRLCLRGGPPYDRPRQASSYPATSHQDKIWIHNASITCRDGSNDSRKESTGSERNAYGHRHTAGVDGYLDPRLLTVPVSRHEYPSDILGRP